MAVYPAGNEAFLTPRVITPQHYNVYAGLSGDEAIDTAAMQWAFEQAKLVNGVVYLGAGAYYCNESVAELFNAAIAVVGSGQAQCQIYISPSMSGDLMSFSNCWYGSGVTTVSGGGAGNGTSFDVVTWPSRTARKHGVKLYGFSVIGSRDTSATQNGIMFYDRNDGVHIEDVDFYTIKGHALVVAGYASNPAANDSFTVRESHIKNVHARWCGDRLTGRIPIMANSKSRDADSADDNVNYVHFENVKAIFPDGPGVALNSFNTNSNRNHHGNSYQITVDSPLNVSSAEVNSGYSSITNGVLTIAGGATILRTLEVGQYLSNEAVPLGTYIAAQLTGTPGGVGTYQLANNTLDISTLTKTSGQLFTLRPAMHFIQVGGGHIDDHFRVVGNASNTLGSGCGLIEFNHNILDASTGKTRQCRLDISIGKMDHGMVFTVINSLSVSITMRESVTSISALSVTQKVSVNVGQELFDARLAIGGQRDKIVVHCDGEQVVTSLPQAEKYPGAFMVLDTGSAYERYFSKAAGNSAAWELVA